MKIIEKPWGREEIIEINDKYMMKKLTMFKNHRCSLQYHNHKKETIFVLSGQLRIISGKNIHSRSISHYNTWCSASHGRKG